MQPRFELSVILVNAAHGHRLVHHSVIGHLLRMVLRTLHRMSHELLLRVAHVHLRRRVHATAHLLRVRIAWVTLIVTIIHLLSQLHHVVLHVTAMVQRRQEMSLSPLRWLIGVEEAS